jgi:hypothetical protein
VPKERRSKETEKRSARRIRKNGHDQTYR